MLKIALIIIVGTLCLQLARSLGWRRGVERRERNSFGKKRVIDADFEDID